MRVIGSVEVRGVEYEGIWGRLPSTKNDPSDAGSANVLFVRNSDGANETFIHRNAKLAEIETSLRHLRKVGLKDPQLCQLFNFIGNSRGLAHHIKMLMSNLR